MQETTIVLQMHNLFKVKHVQPASKTVLYIKKKKTDNAIKINFKYKYRII